MYERRLRILLIVVFALMTVLLARAAQLQVFNQGQWREEAAALGRRRELTETTRGRILDHKGHVIAVDEPCIDAWVEFGAISRDEEWVRSVALRRLATTQPGVYRKAGTESRKVILAGAMAKVIEDLDRMWEALARETGQSVEEIEQARLAIEQRVLMRERYLQYRKFEKATDARKRAPEAVDPHPAKALVTTTQQSTTAPAGASTTTKPSLIHRILTAGSSDEIEVDHFEFESEETRRAHAVVRNIKPESYTRLAKDIDDLPGLVLKQGAARRYPYGKAGAHLLGHLGVVTKEDLESSANPKDDDLREYLATDLIGRGGLEQLAEPTLRGTRGFVKHPLGKTDEVLESQKSSPGRDVHTTIDIELQAQLQSFFEHAKIQSHKRFDERTAEVAMHGAAVVIDIPSNEVRALASYPDFDPNELVDRYAELARDRLNAPLMNRATHAQLEPGSTVKPVVGLGAITDGQISVTGGIECTGYLIIGITKQPHGKCWTAGLINDPQVGPANVPHHRIPTIHQGSFGNAPGHLCFADALERSCNVYFETLAHRMGQERLAFWFDKFGLGHETGLGIAEARGLIPGPESRAMPSLTWFSAIGQTTMQATPIQMANVTATIARRGVWMKPKLVKPADGLKLEPVKLRGGRVLPEAPVNLNLLNDAVDAAHEGMRRVVNGGAGTGEAAKMTEFIVAGKTGTAQGHPRYVLDESGDPVKVTDEKGKTHKLELERATMDHATKTPWYRGWGPDGSRLNHSWFVCYAPADRPQVAVAVMVEYGGSGGTAAGAIAKKILMACVEHGYLKMAR